MPLRTARKTREHVDDLLIRDLPEIRIIEPDRTESLIVLQANDVVGFLAHSRKRVRWSDRHCEHELLRVAHTGGTKRRACRGAGRDAVIDHDCNTASNIDSVAVAQITSTPTFDFGKLAVADGAPRQYNPVSFSIARITE